MHGMTRMEEDEETDHEHGGVAPPEDRRLPVVDDGLFLGGGADGGDGHVRIHGHQDRALLQLVHLLFGWVR